MSKTRQRYVPLEPRRRALPVRLLLGRPHFAVIHELPLERRTLHGHFSRDLQPVLTVDPGDSVRFRRCNAGWRGMPARRSSATRSSTTGHALLGPIEVRGARAGRRSRSRRRGAAGRVGRHVRRRRRRRLAARRRRVASTSAAHVVELAPFLGVIGMPPPEPGVHSTIPPRRWGGNIDCKELVAGTTLFLPIPVDGALLSGRRRPRRAGRRRALGHGDRVPARARADHARPPRRPRAADAGRARRRRVARVRLRRGPRVRSRQAIDGILDLIERELGVERGYAAALASVAVDLRITQMVNGVKGVHAVLRDDAIR